MADLDSNEDDEDTPSFSEDLNQLMHLVGKKLKTSTMQEKIKLLALVPQSGTCKKTVETFGVTDHMVRRSRQLRREKSSLADPYSIKGGRALSQVV